MRGSLLQTGPPTWLWLDLGGGQTRDLCRVCAREQGTLRTLELGYTRYVRQDLEYVLRNGGIRCERCGQVDVSR